MTLNQPLKSFDLVCLTGNSVSEQTLEAVVYYKSTVISREKSAVSLLSNRILFKKELMKLDLSRFLKNGLV